jgi:hypothetical protein
LRGMPARLACGRGGQAFVVSVQYITFKALYRSSLIERGFNHTDDLHFSLALGTYQGAYFVHLLYQPRPQFRRNSLADRSESISAKSKQVCPGAHHLSCRLVCAGRGICCCSIHNTGPSARSCQGYVSSTALANPGRPPVLHSWRTITDMDG